MVLPQPARLLPLPPAIAAGVAVAVVAGGWLLTAGRRWWGGAGSGMSATAISSRGGAGVNFESARGAPPPGAPATMATSSTKAAAEQSKSASPSAVSRPPPPSMSVLRLLWLAVTATPGFWSMPYLVLTVAAVAAGGDGDAFTLTFCRRRLATFLVSGRAVGAAAALPVAALTNSPTLRAAWRVFEPLPREVAAASAAAADAAAAAGCPPPPPPPPFEAAVMPAVGPRVTAAVAAGWAAAAPTVTARMDAAIDARLDTAVAAAGSRGGGIGGGVNSAVVDLFDTLSCAIAAAAVVVVAGPAYDAAYGDATVAGVMDWPPIAWGVPALWFPGVTRAVRRREAAAFHGAMRPLVAAAAKALSPASPDLPEPETYLAVLAGALRAEGGGIAAGVTPTQVAVHLYGALVGAHINTAATAGWAAAHVAAAGAATRAAVTAEVDAVLAGRPPPVAATVTGGAAAVKCVTGLPTLESAWAEARRFYFAIPAVRFARESFRVPPPPVAPKAITSEGGGHTDESSGDDDGSGWTVPGDGGPVLLSVLDASRGSDYYTDGDTFNVRRFLPAAAGGAGVSATAAAAAGRLYGLGWGPDAAASTAESQLLLSRLWRRLYSRYDVTLVDGPSGGGGGRASTVPLPSADQLRAVATAQPTRRVWVRLTRRGKEKGEGGCGFEG